MNYGFSHAPFMNFNTSHLTDEQFDLDQRHELWCRGKERKFSRWEAIYIFRADLYGMCMEGMQGIYPEIWKDLLWELKNFSRDDFRQKVIRAKERPITEVLQRFGIDAPRMHKIPCCFHEDPNASCHIYEDTNSWYCFGCAAGGDTIDFVRRKMGCGFRDAVEYLN